MDRNKKTKKKSKKRTREAIGRAPDHDARSLKVVDQYLFVVSFLFRLNLFLFFFVRRESRLIQTHLVLRARIFISSSLRAEYQHQHQHHRTHASTRAPFVVGKSFGKSSESRGEVREEQRERAATVRVFERRKRRFKRRRCTHTHWKRRGIDEKNQHQRGLEEDKELVEQ